MLKILLFCTSFGLISGQFTINFKRVFQQGPVSPQTVDQCPYSRYYWFWDYDYTCSNTKTRCDSRGPFSYSRCYCDIARKPGYIFTSSFPYQLRRTCDYEGVCLEDAYCFTLDRCNVPAPGELSLYCDDGCPSGYVCMKDSCCESDPYNPYNIGYCVKECTDPTSQPTKRPTDQPTKRPTKVPTRNPLKIVRPPSPDGDCKCEDEQICEPGVPFLYQPFGEECGILPPPDPNPLALNGLPCNCVREQSVESDATGEENLVCIKATWDPDLYGTQLCNNYKVCESTADCGPNYYCVDGCCPDKKFRCAPCCDVPPQTPTDCDCQEPSDCDAGQPFVWERIDDECSSKTWVQTFEDGFTGVGICYCLVAEIVDTTRDPPFVKKNVCLKGALEDTPEKQQYLCDNAKTCSIDANDCPEDHYCVNTCCEDGEPRCVPCCDKDVEWKFE